MKRIEYLWAIVLVSVIFCLLSCSQGETIEEVNVCAETHTYYNELILEEAKNNGYDVSAGIHVNNNDILSPGFLDITHDPNTNAYLQAWWKYIGEYRQAIEELNCN